jgi:signal transduction histidine kinase
LTKQESKDERFNSEKTFEDRSSREEFAKGLVHEFANMVTAVIGYSELALEAIENTHPARNWLEKIRDRTKELALLVRKLTAMNQKSEKKSQQ